jgi:hypothetical protein
MKRIFNTIILVFLTKVIFAQAVNYSEHIAPIIYKNCTTCHRPGEVGPFSLTNYTEVAAYSKMIKYVTAIKYMPPWKADVEFQRFQGENTLTASQIKQIGDWVDAGTPRGDANLEPKLPVFPKGSQVGIPDKVVSFKKKYTHKGNNIDEYRYFVLPTGLTEDKDLIALEVRPGNIPVVHHTLVWADTTGAAAKEDAKTPEYGYESPQNNTFDVIDAQLPGYVPGQRAILMSHGIAQRLKKGSDLKLQMHYAPTPTDETDSTTINLYFAKQPAKRYIKSKVMLPFFGGLVNGPFSIPANTVKEFHGIYTFTEKASLLGISPHMHKLGQRWIVYAVTPTKDTINLIRIKEWDFNWQGEYNYKKPIILPKGTVVHAYAKYDNTTKNPVNPFSPPKLITWGEGTSAEMFYLPLMYVSYQAGDENIVFEGNSTAANDPRFYTIGTELYPIAPNPASSNVKLGFTLVADTNVALNVYNMNGQLVKSLINNRLYATGLHTIDMDVSNESNGLYLVVLEANGQKYTQKMMVSH